MVGHEYLIRTIYLFSCSVDESKTGSLEGSAFVLSLRQENIQRLGNFCLVVGCPWLGQTQHSAKAQGKT